MITEGANLCQTPVVYGAILFSQISLPSELLFEYLIVIKYNTHETWHRLGYYKRYISYLKNKHTNVPKCHGGHTNAPKRIIRHT